MIEWCGRLLLCLTLLCGSAIARAQPAEKVLFYYPIAVGGEITRLIDQRVAEFEASHPAIDIEPVYSGTYKESLDKVLAANKSAVPPTLAVLHAVECLPCWMPMPSCRSGICPRLRAKLG